MAQSSDAVSSHPLTVETTTTQKNRSTGTLTCPPPELPTLPFDVLPEILCRLPVKLLVQLRCLCKFFNSLISDPKFAKKHLQLSTKRHHLMVTSKNNLGELVHHDSPIPSLFSTSTVITQTQLYPPTNLTNGHKFMLVRCYCDGIFCCVVLNGVSFFLWNPSIRKFKLLPPLENSRGHVFQISFGYDHFIDDYKVIGVSSENEVSVYTLGTDYWTRIKDIPYSDPIYGNGVFVSGTVNWLACDDSCILSLDLEKESYQQLFLPDFENENDSLILSVLRDCLCVFATIDRILNVWIMKEYGNRESWTKLYSVPNMQDRGLDAYEDLEPYTVSYISEDDQLLVGFFHFQSRIRKLVVYDSKTDTLNIPEFQNNYEPEYSNVYIESLISP
ncbi:putative F-box domain, galactose oxidase/kelch, beta-propeller, F-box associated interaction [Medicago truncatula]|uniref:F-box protein interaction domain protein n=1 Tax=Medicago truncatula TaxID=3880 RepID=G7IVG1_MEDTR|nr:F-box/kelch-repeat protein At3g23880 [Medicago truncatula]AES68599.1 F-box protein interaction domain protein [Medicago truncatula]RHN65475.1 putative F-box domain, galactose oxidase/kelch, beta-propeller, F-box associated interaction [Medicago truncatula]